MIIQTTRISRTGGIRYLARHLLDKTSENERIEVLAGDRHALDDAQTLAAMKGCTYSIRHLSISPEFEMTPVQLSVFVRSIDKEFGIGPDRPRLVVRHVKKGRSHFHLAIAEVDPTSLRVLDCRKDYVRLENLARDYERNHGETIQPAWAERRVLKTEGFSDKARKKAERVSPGFDRTKLKGAFAIGPDAFVTEVQRQGLQFADGEKGPILVTGTGAFVAAANRATGTSRAAFTKIMEDITHDGNYFRIPAIADLSGEKHQDAIAPAIPAGETRGARPHRPAHGLAGEHSRCAAPSSRSVKGHGRTNRPPVLPIVSGPSREHWFLYRLGKVDLDDLLIRAREMAAWVQSIFEPQTVRLTRQIRDLKRKREKFGPADASEAPTSTYYYGRRMTP